MSALAALAVASLLGAPARADSSGAKEAVVWGKLRERVDAVDKGLDGVLGVWVKDLRSGRTIELRANEVFPTASAIKIAVLYELYRQAEEGAIDLVQVTQPPLPRTGGDGVLQLLSDRISLTWRDLAVFMMGLSDNEAANLLIDKVGRDAVNRRLDSLGLTQTRLRRRMMDLEAARRGDENLATPAELGRLMEVLAKGTGLAPERAKDMMAVARGTKWGSGPRAPSPFRAPLPESVPVADKAGELEGVRCVVAFVDLPGRPYVAALMTTYLRRDEEGEEAIRTLSAALFETFDRLARASEHGRIIDDR